MHLCDGVRQEYQLPEGEEHALVGFGQDRLLIWSAGEEETTAWLDWRTGELLPDRAWDNAASPPGRTSAPTLPRWTWRRWRKRTPTGCFSATQA